MFLQSGLIIAVSLFSQSPNERARLYFLLAWFHAVIQERLRYAPLGWSKKYEFGESDLRSACDTVDTWLDDTAKVRVQSLFFSIRVCERESERLSFSTGPAEHLSG